MDPKKKQIILWAGGGIAIAILVFVIIFWRSPHSGIVAPGGSAPELPANSLSSVAAPTSAYQMALARATQWEPDAGAVKATLKDTAGRSWMFLFVSSIAKGKGFQVTVAGGSITGTQVVDYIGSGSLLPSNIISPDDAIAAAHQVPGYTTVAVTSLEVIYNAPNHQWYWGVNMANGTSITIKATP